MNDLSPHLPEEASAEAALDNWKTPELQKLPVSETADRKKLIDTEGLELS
jgi:hypothetical protein